jgi:hypothetical protein
MAAILHKYCERNLDEIKDKRRKMYDDLGCPVEMLREFSSLPNDSFSEGQLVGITKTSKIQNFTS